MDEETKRKVRELESDMRREGFDRPPTMVREAFPEAFLPEKHWVIQEMEGAIKFCNPGMIRNSLEIIRSAFNDDATLKEKP